MLFLDANAFYYYYGSRKLGQIDPPILISQNYNNTAIMLAAKH